MISDLLWSLPVPQLFVCHTLQKKKKKVILIITLAGQHSLMSALPVLCKHPCPYASTSSVVCTHAVLFFCFASLQAQQLLLFRLALAEFFFSPRSTSFFFFLSWPRSLSSSVSLSLTHRCLHASSSAQSHIHYKEGRGLLSEVYLCSRIQVLKLH